jgi:threonine dehydrogenase-like Zn-dependent dehydrogenase
MPDLMRELTYVAKRRLEWSERPVPRLTAADDALVEPLAAARCDLDNAFLLTDLTPRLRAGLALHVVDPLVKSTFGIPAFRGPFAYGHECVARVTEIGPAVAGIAVGDIVVVPFQVSCGACDNCRRDLTAHCTTDRRTPIKAFGFGDATGGLGGMVTDRVRVPFASHMLVKVPPGIPIEHIAGASDNIADGWRTVARHLGRRPGSPVLVLGGSARSVSLYAVAAAIALGSERVDYVDTSRRRLAIAEALGANPVAAPRRIDGLRNSAELIGGDYPIAVDGSGRSGALRFALRSLLAGGVCTSVAFYVRNGTAVPLWQMYVNGLTLTTGLANVRPYLPEILAAVANRTLRPQLVTTTLANWEEAPQALLEPGAKVVITRT